MYNILIDRCLIKWEEGVKVCEKLLLSYDRKETLLILILNQIHAFEI